MSQESCFSRCTVQLVKGSSTVRYCAEPMKSKVNLLTLSILVDTHFSLGLSTGTFPYDTTAQVGQSDVPPVIIERIGKVSVTLVAKYTVTAATRFVIMVVRRDGVRNALNPSLEDLHDGEMCRMVCGLF